MLMISTIKRLYFLILVSSIYLGLGPPPLINKSWFFLFEGIHPPRLFHPLARVILIVKCFAGGRPARRRTSEEEDWRYSLLLTSMLRVQMTSRFLVLAILAVSQCHSFKTADEVVPEVIAARPPSNHPSLSASTLRSRSPSSSCILSPSSRSRTPSPSSSPRPSSSRNLLLSPPSALCPSSLPCLQHSAFDFMQFILAIVLSSLSRSYRVHLTHRSLQ